jgi:hypothetical protein
MIKKAKSFLANHPRMRIVAILGGAICIFSVAMHVVNHKQVHKKPHTPASFAATQKVDLKNKLPKSFDHKKMLTKLSKQKDADIRNSKISHGATMIPGGWFNTHTDSIVTNAKNKDGKTITKSPAKTIAKNNTATTGQNKNQALAKKTNGVIKDTNKKVMSPDEFVKAMKAQEANIHPVAAHNYASYNNSRANNSHNNSHNNSYNNNRNLRDFSQKRLEEDNQRPLTQKQRMREQNKKQEINRVAGGLKAELDSATQNSENTPTPSFEDINQSAYVNTAKEAAQAKAAAKKAKDSQILIKAGTIYYAVTTNMVSSDQSNTPVLAQMINGPYRGAKLIGNFNTEGEKLVMQFNTMVMKSRKRSFSIGGAYAIDTKDGQLAVQTAVNHHYLKRYGALLASSFLKGLGEAVTPVNGISGSSTNLYCNDGGTVTTINGISMCVKNTHIYNPSQTTGYNGNNPNSVTGKVIALRGAGEIGNKLSDNVGQVFNTPITVTVAQGTLVGILFTHDTVIPAIDNGGAQDDPDYASSNNQGTLDFLKDND